MEYKMSNNVKTPFVNSFSSDVKFNDRGHSGGNSTIKRLKTDEERSIESKLISPSPSQRIPQQKGPDGTPYPGGQLSSTIINDTARNIVDGRNLTRLLPDIKTARLLLVSAILSPNDLVNTELTFCNESDDFGNLKSQLLEIIQDHIEGLHKMEESLPVWLDEILFEKGAKVFMVLPESQLDDIINGDLKDRTNRLRVESFANSISDKGFLPPQGLLGSKPKDAPPKKYGINDIAKRHERVSLAHESGNGIISSAITEFKGERNIQFTMNEDHNKKYDLNIDYVLQDNAEILKLSILNEKLALEEARLRFSKNFKIYTTTDWEDLYDITPEENAGNVAVENFANGQPSVGISKNAQQQVLNIGDNEAHGVIRDRSYSWKPVQSVKDNFRGNKGEPLRIEVPAECVVPAYLFGRPNDHIGYFFAVEPSGTFVTITDDTDYYREMMSSRDSSENTSGQMIDQVVQTTYGSNGIGNQRMNVREEQQLLSAATLNHQFLESLQYGAYNGIKLAVGNTEGISRLMLARALSGDQTHFLFVPKDIVTYIAFDYNDYGVGISLLAQNKMQGAIRAMMQFVNVQAAINNAIVHSKMNISLDEYEADSERTVEQIYHEHIRRKVASFPLGVSSPLSQLEYMVISGLNVNVEQHPDFPNTKVDMEYLQNNVNEIDNEFTENLKNEFLLGLGIDPSSIDMSMGVELAQSIVTSNIMLAKRALIYQNKFCAGLTEYFKISCLQSPSLKSQLIDAILENKDVFNGQVFYKKLCDKDNAKARVVANKLALKFLSEMYVSLPKPDLKTLEMQKNAIEEKEEYYDLLVEYVISEDIVVDWVVGESVAEKTTYFRTMFKNHLMRQWIQENNFAPEVFSILGLDDNDDKIIPLLEANKQINEKLGRFFAGYIKESTKSAEKIETIATNAGLDESTTTNSFDSTPQPDGNELNDDIFNTDDNGPSAFGNDNDLTIPKDGDEI